MATKTAHNPHGIDCPNGSACRSPFCLVHGKPPSYEPEDAAPAEPDEDAAARAQADAEDRAAFEAWKAQRAETPKPTPQA